MYPIPSMSVSQIVTRVIFSWTILFGAWEYLFICLQFAFPTSTAMLWITCAALWIAVIPGFLVSGSALYYWVTDRATGARAILVIVDSFFAYQFAAAGVYATGWLLDTSPGRTAVILLPVTTVNSIEAYTQLLVNTVTLFNSAGMVSTIPLSILMGLWTFVVSNWGRLFFVLLVSTTIRRKAEQATADQFFDRPYGVRPQDYRPGFPMGGYLESKSRAYGGGKSKAVQRRNKTRKTIVDAIPGNRVYVQTGDNKWVAK